MGVVRIVFLILVSNSLFAQSKISFQLGSTFSKVRAIYNKELVKPGPYFHELVDLSILAVPHIAFEYEYDYRKLRLSTGFGFTNLGAGSMPMFPEEQWNIPYWVVPVLGGYRHVCSGQWSLLIEGGAEIGFSDKGYSTFMGGGAYWGNINAVIGVEAEYRRFRLGVRGQLGLTDFRYVRYITYKHTAVTTYLSYTIWDHAKAKQRRLEREQAKRLGE